MRTKIILCIALFLLVPSVSAHGTNIHITEKGFEPAKLEIEQGETIEFENLGTEYHWPASNIHPTHETYPEFDPRRPLAPNESWEFTFDEPGVWRFHDHAFPEFTGVITVRKSEKIGFFSGIVAFFKKIGQATGLITLEDELLEKYNYNESISESSEEIWTNDDALYSYVKKYGPKRTVLHLHELQSKLGDCHQTAHSAGRLAYELFNDQAFKTCSAECHSGCYHGAMEAYFKEHGTDDLANNLNVLCSSELNDFFLHQCIHGIGHGLMAWSDYEIFEALKGCDMLNQRQDSCWTGVFMENIVGGLANETGHKTKYLSDDPLNPCNIVGDKYKGSCYFLQSSRMMQLFAGNFSKIAEACSKAETEYYQRSCFESMGRDVGGVSRGNPEKAIAHCSNAPKGEMRIGCLTGAVQDSFWDPSGQDAAIAFCKMIVEKAEKRACYETIFERAPLVLAQRDDMKSFCNKVEMEFENECIGK